MSLLTLPVELRLRIYEYLPELLPHFNHNILSNSQLTPSICRVNTTIRRETLPIHATDSLFAVCIDDSPDIWKRRIDCWVSALGPSTNRIRGLQISRHWKMLRPERYMTHVGFYVRVERVTREAKSSEQTESVSYQAKVSDGLLVRSRGLNVMTGTYPMLRDPRNMRFESVELLARVFRDRLSSCPQHVLESSHCGLLGEDIRFLVEAIDIVASYKVPHEMDLESNPQRRYDVSEDMEKGLRSIDPQCL